MRSFLFSRSVFDFMSQSCTFSLTERKLTKTMRSKVAFCSQFKRDKLLQATRFIDIHVLSAQGVQDNWAVKVGLISIILCF